MKIAFLLLVCIVFVITGCSATSEPGQGIMKKIEIDLSVLDENGLRGEKEGKTSVSYEFCIPDNETCKNEIKSIDKTVQFFPGSKGRIGAKDGECLCIGNTNQTDFQIVLEKLASLSYIERIIECFFE